MSILNVPVQIKYTSTTTPSANYTVTLQRTYGSASYSLYLPATNTTGFLMNNGSGSLSWQPAIGSTFTSPLNCTVNSATISGLITATQTGTGCTGLVLSRTVSSTNWVTGVDVDNNYKISRSTNVAAFTKVNIGSSGVSITDPLTVCGYTLPSTVGPAGKYLRTDGVSSLYWGDVEAPTTYDYIYMPLNNAVQTGNISINQSGVGDSAVSFSIPPSAYYILGIHNSDKLFKICRSTTMGVNELMTFSASLAYIKTQLRVGPNYFPTNTGSFGQYLRTDGAGTLYWSTGSGSSGGPPFSVAVDINLTDTSTTGLLRLNQTGTGDSSCIFRRLTDYYSVGIDSTGTLKFSYGASLGTNDRMVIDGAGVQVPQLTVASYTLPLTDGTSGQVIQTDGAGTLSWVSGSSPSSVVVKGGQLGPLSLGTTDDTQVSLLANNVSQLDVTSLGVSVTNLLTVGPYTFPSLDGTVDQVIKTDGAGTLSWVTPLSSSDVILKSGQLGPLSLGSTDDTQVSLLANNVSQLDVTSLGVSVTNSLTVGSYTLPLVDGTVDQVIQTDGAGTLSWVTVSTSSSTVLKGGQPGPVNIGSTDATQASLMVNNTEQLTITSAGDITLGNVSTLNSLNLIGGIRYQVQTDNTGDLNINLTINDYFVVVGNSGTQTVTLPASVGNGGRAYIVGRGFAGGAPEDLRLVAGMGDTIDGDASLEIPVQNARIQVISDGNGTWMVL